MRLHQNKLLFTQTLRAASQYLQINLNFVEKDYWITLVLQRLSTSEFSEKAVFKGGTSLSKGYGLIDRFSEDIDLAIISEGYKSLNEIKTTIRRIEKEITKELTESREEGVTSKGSRYRKSVYHYPVLEKDASTNRIIIEINSFANPFPFQKRSIYSMIFEFLNQKNNFSLIEEYQLHPFEINVLNKEQTMLEKLVSLIRFSFDEDYITSISGKIRHFYDLYYLAQDPECVQFVYSKSFKQKFFKLLQHDMEIFKEPKGWNTKPLFKSPLLFDFESIWNILKKQYESELIALAYRSIPDEKQVAQSFIQLLQRIV